MGCANTKKVFLVVAGGNAAAQRHFEDTIQRNRNNPKDPYHSLRNFLYRMHTHRYRNASGKIVKLPHRVAPSAVKAARRAGKRAWA